jgi:hypothetical protein
MDRGLWIGDYGLGIGDFVGELDSLVQFCAGSPMFVLREEYRLFLTSHDR